MKKLNKELIFDSKINRQSYGDLCLENPIIGERVEVACVITGNDDMPMENLRYDDDVLQVSSTLILLETLLSGGLSVKKRAGQKKIRPCFHPFSGQQIQLSNIPTLYYDDKEVLEIVFPPTGYEFFTTKYGNTTVFNTSEGYLVKDKPAHIVNYAMDYDITAEESVVFCIKTSEEIYYLRWTQEYIEWLMEDVEIGYYRMKDGNWINYSDTQHIDSAICTTVSSAIEKDILLNVDGVNLIVPRCPVVALESQKGYLVDNKRTVYGPTDLPPATYLVNVVNMETLCLWKGRPDSPAQVELMKRAVWTVPKMLKEWRFPIHKNPIYFSGINYFSDWMDSLQPDLFQIKKEEKKGHPTSSHDLVHRYMNVSSMYESGEFTLFVMSYGCLYKNILYQPYKDMYSLLRWIYKGVEYSQVRTAKPRIYVKTRYKNVPQGWWYPVDDT